MSCVSVPFRRNADTPIIGDESDTPKYSERGESVKNLTMWAEEGRGQKKGDLAWTSFMSDLNKLLIEIIHENKIPTNYQHKSANSAA